MAKVFVFNEHSIFTSVNHEVKMLVRIPACRQAGILSEGAEATESKDPNFQTKLTYKTR